MNFQKIRELFPALQLQQTYGLSELGVLRTKSREDGSLWVKVGGEGFQTQSGLPVSLPRVGPSGV